MKSQITDKLNISGRDLLLPHYQEWTIIEDQGKLEGASKAQARVLFSDWVARASVERDGPSVDEARVRELPRFNYCLRVDRECLDTLDAYEEWDSIPVEPGMDRFALNFKKGQNPPVVCAIMDKSCAPEGKGEDGYPSLEGCTRYYLGCISMDVSAVPGLYDDLHHFGLVRGLGEYGRPPLVYPRLDGLSSMPYPKWSVGPRSPVLSPDKPL